MADREIVAYLRERGCPEHVWKGGRADLDVRALIAEIGAEAQVREADERLRRTLTGCDHRVWESAPGSPFWDFGYPGNASGDLRDDLAAEDLL